MERQWRFENHVHERQGENEKFRDKSSGRKKQKKYMKREDQVVIQKSSFEKPSWEDIREYYAEGREEKTGLFAEGRNEESRYRCRSCGLRQGRIMQEQKDVLFERWKRMLQHFMEKRSLEIIQNAEQKKEMENQIVKAMKSTLQEKR